ncbi:hypothetical protein B7494_g6731 [Chlorociboria aeruginascens]|nr:hypothetical protein B7494_g6731 [Chlorociboria aeruginascens]
MASKRDIDNNNKSSRTNSVDSSSEDLRDALLSYDDDNSYRGFPRQHQNRKFWILHGALLLFNISILISMLVGGQVLCLPDLKKSNFPSWDSMEFERSKWNLSLGDISPYTAPPGPEVDALWSEITAHEKVGAILVQKDDLDRVNKTSIKLSDGSGYIAVVDDYLRRIIYNDTYGMSREEDPVHDAHIPHCIDSIRLSLQCRADTSLIPFHWIENYPLPWPDFSSVHQCQNWDKIHAWANAGRKDLKALLMHPIYGAARKEAYNASIIPLRKEDVHFIDENGARIEVV